MEGYVGNFKVKIRRKPKYVDENLCVGCLECIEACIFKKGKIQDEFNVGLSMRKPIYIPFPQATPLVVLIDPETVPPVQDRQVQADLRRGLRSQRDRLRPEGEDQGDRGRGDHPGHRLQDLRRLPGLPSTVTAIPERLHQPRSGAAGQRVRADRRRGASSATAEAESGRHRPLRRQSRRKNQPVLLARLLHVLARSWPT